MADAKACIRELNPEAIIYEGDFRELEKEELLALLEMAESLDVEGNFVVFCEEELEEIIELSAHDIGTTYTCPECGAELVRFEGEAAHYCPNDSACPPQIKGRIEHFISRKAMNIDSLGPETIDDYYQRGLIRDISDLYKIKVAHKFLFYYLQATLFVVIFHSFY